MKYLEDEGLSRMNLELMNATILGAHSKNRSNVYDSDGFVSHSHQPSCMSSSVPSSSASSWLSSSLSSASSLGGEFSSRVIHGRIEAFTMKRAGTDKKLAHAIGERFVSEMEQYEQQLAAKAKEQKKSQTSPAIKEQQQPKQRKKRRTTLRQNKKQRNKVVPVKKKNKTKKKVTFKANTFHSSSKTATMSKQKTPDKNSRPHSLYNGTDLYSTVGTRRLMTDLILTLNASFPDYDFLHVARPQHFVPLSVQTVVQRTNQCLGELALCKQQQQPIPSSSSSIGPSSSFKTPAKNPQALSSPSRTATTTTRTIGGGNGFLQDLWTSIDNVISLKDCMVFSYVPPSNLASNDDAFAFMTETLLEQNQDYDNYHYHDNSSVSSSSFSMQDDDEEQEQEGAKAGNGVNDQSGEQSVSSHASSAERRKTVTNSESVLQETTRRPFVVKSLSLSSSPMTPPVLWTFNYFFVNKQLKRILLFSCLETIKTASSFYPSQMSFNISDDDWNDDEEENDYDYDDDQDNDDYYRSQ